MSVRADLPVGSELLGYRIEAVLGRGGMGVVYLAEDLRLKRKVALKLLSPRLAEDGRFRERLLAESELAASLDHPNIVPIYATGEAEGRIFISMRYVVGEDLKRLLRKGPLSPEHALALVSQLAGALDAAHARGLVHRDVKPSNVLIAPQAGPEGTDHVYLVDFGLTRRLSEQELASEQGQLMGTVDYVAPEQIRGEPVDGRADVYSLGCLLFECLAGAPPFRHRSDLALLFAHLQEEPPSLTAPRAELPQAMDSVVAKALAKEPDDRYQSCRELVEAARSALGIAEPRRSRWPFALAAVAIALIGAALVAFFLTRGGGAPASAATGWLQRIDPARNRVSETLRVGERPSGVTVGAGRVWLTTYGDDTLWRVDPSTLRLLKIPAGDTPTSVAVSNGIAYVANGPFGGGVTRIDASTGGMTDRVATGRCCPGGSTLVAAGPDGAWAVVGDGVARLSTGDEPGRIVERIRVPFPLPNDSAHFRYGESGLALGEGALWVVGDPIDHRLWRLDRRRDRVISTVRLPFAPDSVVAGLGDVWVSAEIDDLVARIDPASGRIVATIRVGRGAAHIALGAGSVWVTSAIDGTVSRIDPSTNRVVATIRTQGSPSDVAVGERSVWVAVDAG